MSAAPPLPAPRVAVVGLGNLGLAIAERLQDKGLHVRGHDVSPDARRRAEERGLTVADSLAGAVVDADVVSLVVGTAAQVRTCLEGLLRPGRGSGADVPILVHATVAPAEVVALAAEVGPGLVDAPVSGGPERARSGDLAVMVGGNGETVLRARAVLETLGRVLPTGAVGSASITKLVGQVVFMTTQGALLEGELLATSYGVAWPDVLAALGEGTADCFAARSWGFFDDIAADYDRSGVPARSRPWAKDLATALAVAADRGVDLPLTATAARVVPPAIDRHGRDRNDDAG